MLALQKHMSVVTPAQVTAPGGAQHVLRLDHSAQMLSATTPRFQRVLDHWHELNLITPYPANAVGSVQAADGKFLPRAEDLPKVYYPTRVGVFWSVPLTPAQGVCVWGGAGKCV